MTGHQTINFLTKECQKNSLIVGARQIIPSKNLVIKVKTIILLVVLRPDILSQSWHCYCS